MPDFPIIDCHVHLWDPRHFRMIWLDNDELLNKRYAPPEYQQHTQGVQIKAYVYLETGCEPPYGLLEAQWVADHAREDPRLKGIVAWAPLEYGTQTRSYLQALKKISPLIKGVRRIVQSESDIKFCLRPDFIRGVQLLHEFNFSCDICIKHPQLASTIEMVRQCPDVSFMLDHLGKPGIKQRLLDPWRAQMKELAALPNVFCKISGIVTEADHKLWTTEDLKPYVEHALSVFGEDRVAFGGDWPVALLASSYPHWVETLDALTATLSVSAKQKLWAGNASRFYRLDT